MSRFTIFGRPITLEEVIRFPVNAGRVVQLLNNSLLRLVSINSAPGVELQVSGQTWHPNEGLQEFLFTHTPNEDRTEADTLMAMRERFLVSLIVSVTAGAPEAGQTRVRVEHRVGGTTSSLLVDLLIAGNITGTSPLSFPNVEESRGVSGTGNVRVITGTDPAMGLEVSETVPTGAAWRFISMLVGFTADATAANRMIKLELDNGTSAYWRTSAQQTTANETPLFAFGSLLPVEDNGPGSFRTLAAGETLIMPAGHRIRTATFNIQSGDQWGTPVFSVIEYLA